MKKFLRTAAIVAAVVIAFAAIVIVIALRATAGLVETADHFFATAKTGNVPGVRTFLSAAFNRNNTDAGLRAILDHSGIARVQDVSWQSRSVENGHGRLQGELRTTDGDRFPLELLLVKEGEAWRIDTIHKTLVGDDDPPASTSGGTLPTNAQQVAMVRAAMHDFAVSVHDKSMAHFRDTVSNLWQSQVDVATLDNAFRNVLESGADFSIVDRMSPEFDAQPALDDNGMLVIQGHYATRPMELTFVQKYVREGVEWKLFGLHVDSRASTAPDGNTRAPDPRPGPASGA